MGLLLIYKNLAESLCGSRERGDEDMIGDEEQKREDEEHNFFFF